MSEVRQRAQAYGSKNSHAGLAWLAIVALLINALVPTAISAASVAGTVIAGHGALCGAGSGGTGPVKETPPAPHHCICCLGGAIGGFLPTRAPTLSQREYGAAIIKEFATDAAIPRRVAYGAPQPRGPPITG